MSKPTELSEVKKQMEVCAVSGVLATTYHRITAGDLMDAKGVLVIILDADGFISHELSESIDSCVAMCMATVTAGRIGREYESDAED